MNLDKIAKQIVSDIAPLAIMERPLDNLDVGHDDMQEIWKDIMAAFGLPDDKWLDAEQFYRAYVAFKSKLLGATKVVADVIADMAQEALTNGYVQFLPRGMSFVSKRSACRLCPPERRLAGLSVTVRVAGHSYAVEGLTIKVRGWQPFNIDVVNAVKHDIHFKYLDDEGKEHEDGVLQMVGFPTQQPRHLSYQEEKRMKSKGIAPETTIEYRIPAGSQDAARNAMAKMLKKFDLKLV